MPTSSRTSSPPPATVRHRGDAEVTLEANPGPDERGDPAALAEAGINRISFGAQSLDAAELRRLGRRHRPGDVADAVAGARAGSPRSASTSCTTSPTARWSPGSTRWSAALELAPDHLSLYALTLDDPDAEGLTGPDGDHLPTTARRTTLARRPPCPPRTRTAPPPSTTTPSIALPSDGWRGYEISNWARPGHESRHNLVYWERRPYEAVGPGAHAFDGATRRWNAARLGRYVAALTPRRAVRRALPPGGAETLDADGRAPSRSILGLRTDRGLPRGRASSRRSPTSSAGRSPPSC